MKNIKSYKLFENIDELEDLFKSSINYELIDDLKDLSLEYLDSGKILEYHIIIYNRYSNIWITILGGIFSHSECFISFKELSDYVTNQLRKLKVESYLHNWDIPIKYLFNIKDVNGLLTEEDYINDDILYRIKHIYPDTKIELQIM